MGGVHCKRRYSIFVAYGQENNPHIWTLGKHFPCNIRSQDSWHTNVQKGNIISFSLFHCM